MSESFHVRLEKERFVFSAAHFITYNGDVCEPLHGHNYHVACEVHGTLDENQYVVDFIVVRDALQKICDSLDHHAAMGLPASGLRSPTTRQHHSRTLGPAHRWTSHGNGRTRSGCHAPPTKRVCR
jgi:6-pyruvoyl tetrahydropterin synthase/QueD family protein